MLIDSLEQMEIIVNKNPQLRWTGWDIEHLVEDDYAEYLQIGTYDRSSGKWYRKSVYHCTEKGWEIPESVV